MFLEIKCLIKIENYFLKINLEQKHKKVKLTQPPPFLIHPLNVKKKILTDKCFQKKKHGESKSYEMHMGHFEPFIKTWGSDTKIYDHEIWK